MQTDTTTRQAADVKIETSPVQDATRVLAAVPHKPLTRAASTGDLERVRAFLLAETRKRKADLFLTAMQQGEAAVKDRADVKNNLVVREFFANSSGAALHVRHAADPVKAADSVIKELGGHSKFQTILFVQDLTPDSAEKLNQALLKNATGGVLVQAAAPVAEEPFDKLLPRLVKQPLLAQDREQIVPLYGLVHDPDDDPNAVCAHTLGGAWLGARQKRDREAVAEPIAGNRDDGRGAKGKLVCGKLVAPLPQHQRNLLAAHGLNVARDWSNENVGAVVMDANRSLRQGESSRYVFASTVRLKLWLKAVFHSTAEHYIQHAGKRDKATLEGAMGVMNALLNSLKGRGWIEAGKASVDYTPGKMKLDIAVLLTPATPISTIEIAWLEEPLIDQH